jgi:hypothetical protein
MHTGYYGLGDTNADVGSLLAVRAAEAQNPGFILEYVSNGLS